MSDHVDVEQERLRAAAQRSYVLPAVLVLVLYFVMYIPGLIANIVFYLQASSDEQLVGRPPEGKGCLLGLLILGVIVPVVAICAAVVFLFGMVAAV